MQIWRALWRWARRRHSNRRKRWVAKKYFHSVGTRNWTFGVPVKDEDRNSKFVSLLYAGDVKIKRYVKVKAEMNPFDPAWELYLEERQSAAMLESLQHRRRLQTLWLSQMGRCLVCKIPVTSESGWHIHHIIERSRGGDDTLANLVLLHPNCHNQVHSQGLTVKKPVLSEDRA